MRNDDALEGALAQELEEALISVETLIAAWAPGIEEADPDGLSYWAYAAYEALCAVCESYAGRDIPYDVDEVAMLVYESDGEERGNILSLEQIISVLGQLRDSIAYWQEQRGLRGFYSSIRE
jgi:hypothetical protein